MIGGINGVGNVIVLLVEFVGEGVEFVKKGLDLVCLFCYDGVDFLLNFFEVY